MVRACGPLICLVACSDYGYRVPKQVTDEWIVQGDVDIIVFGDTSDSMTDTLTTLTENMTRFVTRLESAQSNWHLIAVTGRDGCGQGGVLSADTPGWEDVFKKGITTKPNEDLVDEWGLYDTAQALAETGVGQCNAGFLRDDAWLHVVFISDEDDNSPGFDGPDENYWQTYVDAYLAAKGNDVSKVHLSAVGGPEPVGCAYADFARGYWEAVEATGGDFLSICDNWVGGLDALADSSVVRETFQLGSSPRRDSIQVYVDGLQRIDGWTWREDTRTVTFDAHPPYVGQTVKIRYLLDQ